MIRCENLTKRFVRGEGNKGEFPAVDHVGFTAEDGSIVGILGPNGAGKTTLLRMLGGMMTPDEGTVVIVNADGQKITDPVQRKKGIGYLSNNTKLYERLSARETLRIFGNLYGLDKNTVEERCKAIFDKLDMNEFADQKIGHLSTGQTQRASLSRVFIHDPGIFILDEPTLGLDVISAKTILDMMKEQKSRGKCVLYSTHYMEEAQNICDRIIMLNHGHILANASVEEILEQSRTTNLRDAFFALQEGAEHEGN